MLPYGTVLRDPDTNSSQPSNHPKSSLTELPPPDSADRFPAPLPGVGGRPHAGRPRVLLVDDLPIMRAAVRSLLEHAGMSVVGETADEASTVALIGTSRPDVVMVDLRMTRHDGLSAIRRVRVADPTVQVVAYVGPGRGDLSGQATEAGATLVPDRDGIPFELLRTIDRAYRTRRNTATTD
jgi:CheY-like chemotaxis protein